MRSWAHPVTHEKGRDRDRYRDRGRYGFRTPIAILTPMPMATYVGAEFILEAVAHAPRVWSGDDHQALKDGFEEA
jgi:hypothetical protein